MKNCWRTGQPSLTALTMNGFTRDAKHGFSSWKWSNLAWNSSSSVTIYFILFRFVVLQFPLREKYSFSYFWHGENDRMLLTICVFEKIEISCGNLSSLTWALGSLSLLSNRIDSMAGLPNLGYMYPHGYICLSEGLHLRLAIEGKTYLRIFYYQIFIHTSIS